MVRRIALTIIPYSRVGCGQSFFFKEDNMNSNSLFVREWIQSLPARGRTCSIYSVVIVGIHLWEPVSSMPPFLSHRLLHSHCLSLPEFSSRHDPFLHFLLCVLVYWLFWSACNLVAWVKSNSLSFASLTFFFACASPFTLAFADAHFRNFTIRRYHFDFFQNWE